MFPDVPVPYDRMRNDTLLYKNSMTSGMFTMNLELIILRVEDTVGSDWDGKARVTFIG